MKVRPIRLALGAALLWSGAALAQSPAPDAQAALSERQPARVMALRSVAQPFSDRLVLRGRTEADRHVEVRSEIAGLVASEPIRKGAVVSAGDVLCRLDEGERPAALAEARANLRQAEAEFEAARSLLEKGFTAETETLTRSAQREAARAQVLRAEIEIERLVISAPFDGVLETDTAELGALLQPGSVCASLIALDPIVLVGYAAERDIDRIEPGAAATARLVTGRLVEGTIRFISRSADEQTRTFRVEIAVPNPDLDIRDGMTAEIFIALEAGEAHLAPQSALTLDDKGALGVRLVVEGEAMFRRVEILADTPEGVWLSGLPQQAEIIVVGQEFVDDGAPVEPSYVDAEAL